jgi:sulfur-oxidizing protein SoxY
MKTLRNFGRRQVLAGSAGVASGLAFGWITILPAQATPETAKQLLQSLVKGEPKTGRISIKAPEIAENGNSVPVTITVESPMTEADYVKAVHVVADGNPLPGVASFRFWPASGRAEAQFRIRLAASQKVTAIAEMSDGSLWTDSREVKVTIGGCGG